MIIERFKLGEYKDLGIKKLNINVTDDEINSAIENIRTFHHELVYKEGPIQEGDHVYLNFEGKCEGKNISNGQAKNYELIMGQGIFIEEFEKNLCGLSSGDKKSFNIVFPEYYENDDLRGKTGEFSVEILNVKEENYPKLNEEFIKSLELEGVNTLESLKTHIKKEIFYQKIHNESIDLINAIMRKILDDVEIKYNEKKVDEAVNEMVKDIKRQVEERGINMDVYYSYNNIIGEEELKESVKQEIRTTYLEIRTLEEIASLENIKLDDEEYNNEKEIYKKENNIKEEDIVDENDLKKSFLIKKVVHHLVDINMSTLEKADRK